MSASRHHSPPKYKTYLWLLRVTVFLGSVAGYIYLYTLALNTSGCQCGRDDGPPQSLIEKLYANHTKFYISPTTNCTYEIYNDGHEIRNIVSTCPNQYLSKPNEGAMLLVYMLGITIFPAPFFILRTFGISFPFNLSNFRKHKENLKEIIKSDYVDVVAEIINAILITLSLIHKTSDECHNTYLIFAISIKILQFLLLIPRFFLFRVTNTTNDSEVNQKRKLFNKAYSRYTVIQLFTLSLLMVGAALVFTDSNDVVCKCFFGSGSII